MIDAFNAALEGRLEGFDAVRVDRPPHEFLARVIDGPMRIGDAAITGMLVGDHDGVCVDMLVDEIVQHEFRRVEHRLRADTGRSGTT